MQLFYLRLGTSISRPRVDVHRNSSYAPRNRPILRACLSTFFFDRKCAVERKYTDLIGCDFNYRGLFRSWLRSRPIRSGFLFSIAHFRSKNKVLRHALSQESTKHLSLAFSIENMPSKRTKGNLTPMLQTTTLDNTITLQHRSRRNTGKDTLQ